MLIVQDKEGNRFSAIDSDLATIKRLSMSGVLICPDCKGQMIFRAGEIKINHFSHKNACDYPYGEPETEEHLKGKILLRDHMKSLFPNSFVDLEYRIKETNQRSDVIVIHPNGERLAVEFQCAKISGEKWFERKSLYDEAGVANIWVFGESVHSYGVSGGQIDKEKHRLCAMELEKFEVSNGNRYLNTETNELRFVMGERDSYWFGDTVLRSKEFIIPLSVSFVSDGELSSKGIEALLSEIKKASDRAWAKSIAKKERSHNHISKVREEEEEKEGPEVREDRNKANARKEVLSIANERVTLFSNNQMTRRETEAFERLCQKHGYTSANFPPLFHIDFQNIDLLRTSRYLWQLWLFDKYIYNRVGKRVFLPQVLDDFKVMINQGVFNRGVRLEDRHYSFLIYDYFTKLSELGFTVILSDRNSKYQEVRGDRFPIYEDAIHNAMLSYALRYEYSIIPEISKKKHEFMVETTRLNRLRRNEKMALDKKSSDTKVMLGEIYKVIEKELNLVSQWEYDFVVQMNTNLHKGWTLSEKQIDRIMKIKEKTDKGKGGPAFTGWR